MREKFYFFGSFRETAKTIEDPLVRLEYLEAVIRHGLGDEEIELSPLVKSLMVQTRFTLDRSKEISDSASERGKRGGAPKGNKNAVKSFENTSKQANSSKNKLKQAKTSEVEEEVEEEYKEKEYNKLYSKKKKNSSLTPLELIDAYKADSILSGKIKDADAVKQRVEYKQRKKERAYKTTSGFIQQLAVMVKTVENGMPRTDVGGRLQFAVNQAEENERKGIVWNDKIEQDYLSFKKFNSLGMNKQHNE